jgi:hypothetical protein
MTTQPPPVELSTDFQERLARHWPITCAGSRITLLDVGKWVEFSPSNAEMRIDGAPVANGSGTKHGTTRMTEIHPLLECDAVQPSAAAARDAGDLESFLAGDLRDFEHQTFTVLQGSTVFAVFAFLVSPSPKDRNHDIIVLEIVDTEDGGGVSDNSVHGGPPS